MKASTHMKVQTYPTGAAQHARGEGESSHNHGPPGMTACLCLFVVFLLAKEQFHTGIFFDTGAVFLVIEAIFLFLVVCAIFIFICVLFIFIFVVFLAIFAVFLVVGVFVLLLSRLATCHDSRSQVCVTEFPPCESCISEQPHVNWTSWALYVRFDGSLVQHGSGAEQR